MAEYLLIAYLHKQRVRLRQWATRNNILMIKTRCGMFILVPKDREEEKKIRKYIKKQLQRGEEKETYKGYEFTWDISAYELKMLHPSLDENDV